MPGAGFFLKAAVGIRTDIPHQGTIMVKATPIETPLEGVYSRVRIAKLNLENWNKVLKGMNFDTQTNMLLGCIDALQNRIDELEGRAIHPVCTTVLDDIVDMCFKHGADRKRFIPTGATG